MKEFIKIVVGNLVAFVLLGFIAMVFVIGSLVSLFLPGGTPKVEQGSVLVFDLSANLTDTPPSEDMWRVIEESFGSGVVPVYSVRAVTEAVRAAADDSAVSSLFLRGNFIPQGYGSGFAALRELRAALLDFRDSGKPLVAYLESPTVRDYYVASAADRVLINPYGMVGLSGLASQQIFLAGLLERYGIGVQVTRAGRYKAAVEMFTEEGMSPANREQTEALLADLWREVVETISESRGLGTAELQRLADMRGYIGPEMALEYGLVDGIAYLDQVLREMGEAAGVGDGDFPRIGMDGYLAARKADDGFGHASGTIAILYMEGDIIDGEGMTGAVGGNQFAREIRRLRQEGDVDALVVRVNSPGGSVTAAETIQRELALASQTMPVVVSFGTVAASGGYWVATGADRIFAHPNTITGSIGVFGILPNFQELANRHGVTFDGVRTAKFADVFSLTRPKTAEEMALIQELVDQVYEDFLERVSTGREMPVARVRELAEGRVWSGEDALQLGLVDEIGGLAEAISYAAGEAGLSEWELYEFPRPVDFAEALAEVFEPRREPLVARDPGRTVMSDLRESLRQLQVLNDPRGIYARMPFSLRID